jgi:O-antigen/teichoic acid export membrane protein
MSIDGGRFVRVVTQQMGVNVLIVLIGLVTGPLLGRVLGPSGRGELAAIIVPISLAPTVLALGFAGFTTREVARGKPPGSILGTLTVLALVEGLIFLGPALALVSTLDNETETVRTFLTIGALMLPVSLAGGIVIAVALGRQRWKTISLVRLIPPLGGLLGFLLLYAIGELTVEGTAIVVVVCGAVAVIPALRDLRGVGRFRFERDVVRDAVSFGVKVWYIPLVQASNLRLDQLLLIGLASERQLGLYAVAVTLSGLPAFATSAVASAIFPRVAAGDSALAAQATRTVLLVITLVAIALAAVTPILLPLMFGEAFRPAVSMAFVLLAAAIPLTGATILGSALSGSDRVGRAGLGELIGVVVTIAGLLLFVPDSGGIAAAWVSLVAYSITFAWLLYNASAAFGGSLSSYLLVGADDIRTFARYLPWRRPGRGSDAWGDDEEMSRNDGCSVGARQVSLDRGDEPQSVRVAVRSVAARAQYFYVFAIASVTAVLLRLPALQQPLDRDTAQYATVGWLMGEGYVPYEDVFDHKQPVTYGVYAVLDWLAPRSTVAIRLVAAFAVAAVATLVFAEILRRRKRLRPSALAGLFCLVIAISEQVEGGDLNTEHLMVVFATATMLLAFRARTARSDWLLVATGAAAATTVLTKMSGVFVGLTSVLLIALADEHQRSIVRRMTLFVAGAVVPTALVLGYFAAHDALDSFFFANWTYNREYIGDAPLRVRVENIADQDAILALITTALGIGAFHLARSDTRKVAGPLLLWLMAALAGALLSPQGFPHYFAPVVPAAVVMLFAVPLPRRETQRIVAAGLVIIALPFLVSSVRNYVDGADGTAFRMYEADARAWTQYDNVARVLNAHARSTDRLYVAGAEPGFYWKSGLEPSDRVTFDYVFSLFPNDFADVIQARCSSAPRFVVLPTGTFSEPFRCLQSQGYNVIGRFGSVEVLER